MLFLTMHPRNRVFHFNNCLLRLANPNRWKTDFQNPTVFRSHVSMIKQNHVTSGRGFDSKTQLPVQNGLFCTRIFGNLNFKHQRRHRLGTIDLAYPVSQIWFLKTSAFVTTLLRQKRSRLIRLTQSRAFIATPEKTPHPEPSDFSLRDFSYNVALKQNWMVNQDMLMCWPFYPSDLKTVGLNMHGNNLEGRNRVEWDRFEPNMLLFEDTNHVFGKKTRSKTWLNVCVSGPDCTKKPCLSWTWLETCLKPKRASKQANPWFMGGFKPGLDLVSYGMQTGFEKQDGLDHHFVAKVGSGRTGLSWCPRHAKRSQRVLNYLWFKPKNYALMAYGTYEYRWRICLNPAVLPQATHVNRYVWLLVNAHPNSVYDQLRANMLKSNVFYDELRPGKTQPWLRVLILKLRNKTKSKFKHVQKRANKLAWKRLWPRNNVFLQFALGFRFYATKNNTVLEKQNLEAEIYSLELLEKFVHHFSFHVCS